MFETLENRQMFSVTVETSASPSQSTEPAVNVSLNQSDASASKQVGLGMRKSAGGQTSGVMFLAFTFKL